MQRKIFSFSENAYTVFTYQFFHCIMDTKDRIGILWNICVILYLAIFFISSILSGGPRDKTSPVIDLLYIHCQLIDHFKMFLCIMETKNCNLAKTMFSFLFKSIN